MRLMFHEKVSLGAQREGRDGWIGSQEALVIAVIRDAVCAGRVVIDQAEIIRRACDDLGHLAELIETLRDRPRLACSIALDRVEGFARLSIDQDSIGQEL